MCPSIGQALPKLTIGFDCSSGGLGAAFFDLLFKEIDGVEHCNHHKNAPLAGALWHNALGGYLFRRPTKVEVAPQSGPCRRWMMIDPVLLPFRAIKGRHVQIQDW